MATLAEKFLPTYDVSDSVATVVAVEPEAVYEALLEVDMVEVGRRKKVAGTLIGLRVLPLLLTKMLRGEKPPKAPARLTLKGSAEIPAADGGWVLLDEKPGEELALGLVGRFWRPVIDYRAVSAEEFAGFDEPGYAKTVYALGVKPIEGGGTLLSATMRTATTDEEAKRWFRRYWTLGVGSGAKVLVNGVLDLACEAAEKDGIGAGAGQAA
ncbi:MAG: hypothetical protein ACXWZW_06695 [Solirubrobacterales bacterium]